MATTFFDNKNTHIRIDAVSAESFFTQAIDAHYAQECIVIVPTGRLKRRYKKMAAMHSTRKSVDNMPRFLTFEECIKEVFGKLFSDTKLRLLSDPFRLALVEQAAIQLQQGEEEQRLEYFAMGGKVPPRYVVQKLNSVMYGLKKDGITPDMLDVEIRTFDPDEEDEVFNFEEEKITDIHRFRDIYRIYNAYEKVIAEKYLDPAGLLAAVNKACAGIAQGNNTDFRHISELWQQVFPGCTRLFIDGFTEFSPLEVSFLNYISLAPFAVRLNFDYHEKNGPLFGTLTSTIDNLKGSTNFIPSIDVSEPPATMSVDDLVRYYLFNTETSVKTGSVDDRYSAQMQRLADITEVYPFADIHEEVRSLAKYIKFLLLKEKYLPADIALIIPNEDYANTIREVFRYYKVPVNITDRRSLSESTITREVIALLEAISKGWEKESISTLANSRYLRGLFASISTITKQEKPSNDSPHTLIAVADELRLRGGSIYGGKQGWIDRLHNRLHALKSLEASCEKQSDEEGTKNAKKKRLKVEEALRVFEALTSQAPEPTKSLTAEEFVTFIKKEVIARFAMVQSVAEAYSESKLHVGTEKKYTASLLEEAEREARAFAAFVGVVEEYRSIYSVLDGAKEPSFGDHVQRLKTSLLEHRYQSLEREGYGVIVTSAEQIRRIDYKVTIIAGMADGEVPRAYTPEFFLGKHLPASEENHLKKERLAFYQVLVNNTALLNEPGTPDRKIIFTYPLQIGGSQSVPSPFIASFLKLLPQEKISNENATHWRRPLADPEARVERLHRWQREHYAPTTPPWYAAPAADDDLVKEQFRYAYLQWQQANEEYTPPPTDIWQIVAKLEGSEKIDLTTFEADIEGLGDTPAKAELPLPAEEYFKTIAEVPKSVTVIEEYGQCPFKFFANRILDVDDAQKLDETLSSLERGNFLHTVVYKFYKELQSQLPQDKSEGDETPLKPVRLYQEKLEEYRTRLYQIANEELESISFQHPFFEIDKDTLLGTEFAKGTLEKWLEDEVGRVVASGNLLPALFEFTFGKKGKTDTSAEAVRLFEPEYDDEERPRRSFLLTGSIDRVDIDLDKKLFSVVDYKSGKIDGYAKNIGTTSHQMTLYTAAMKELLKEKFGVDAESKEAVYQTFKSVDKRVVGVPLKEDTINNSIRTALDTIDNIAAGKFSVEPAKDACTYCTFKPICRINYPSSGAAEQYAYGDAQED